MKKSLRYTLRIAGGILGLFLLLYVAANLIIALKKESISQMVISQINNQVTGIIRIGDLSPDYFRSFPDLSVCLSDVSITDSLREFHHHDFLKAEQVRVRIGLLSLVRGKPKIRRVIVEDCIIDLYTDECGYCNLNRKDDVAFKKGDSDIPGFTFRRARIKIQNEFVNSYHDFDFAYLNCDIIKRDSVIELAMNMKSLIHSIGFNMAKGSYLKEKNLNGNFSLFFYQGEKIQLANVKLKIEGHPYLLNGNVFLNTEPLSYDLRIESKKLIYKEGVDLLTQALQQKLDSFDIVEPIDVRTSVAGKMAFRVVPRVTTEFKVNDVALKTTFGLFDHATFSGSFANQFDTLLPPGDPNSKFILNGFYSEYAGIQLTSSRVEVTNLAKPFLVCDIQSNFDLTQLNDLTQSSTLQFAKGRGDLNIKYNGSLAQNDTINPVMNGTFTMNDASFKYVPRNLLFENCTGVIEFKNEDLFITNLMATAGKTQLLMSGNVANFLAMININPAKLKMEWNISTPVLNLDDFLTYVAPQNVAVKKSTRKNKLIKATENIDKLLSDGTAEIKMTAGKMSYKKFAATNVAATILMVENRILMNDVRLNHAGGSISMKGSMVNGHRSNQVNFQSTIKKVDIPGIFYAFDNFGQDAITHTNMKGQLSAVVQVSGSLSDKAQIVENSMKGTVDFSIVNGELNNFDPVMKIAATAFKNRDFSQIRFSQLDNNLKLNGSAIGIDKMEIRSNVVVLFVQGVYDTKKGTDMSIQVPLSNLSKTENEITNTGRIGANVRLRAKTQEDGTLKISWDPFKNALKENK